MTMYHVPELAPAVFAVGVKDWSRRLFDALIPLPEGTTYNAYLIKGQRHTALIDSVNPGFEEELFQRIAAAGDPTALDYLVMNHAEPDHANALPKLLEMNPRATLLTSKKGAQVVHDLFPVPADRVRPVADGDTLDLGGKRLRFIDAPMLHWPETMFTYLEEDGLLFPCDFFGAHTTYGWYADENGNTLRAAKRYYGEIMMPYAKMGARALEKISGLEIRQIAPSHGPVYRDPKEILRLYRRWTAGETEEKAVAVYVSMWGSSERFTKAIVEVLESNGIRVALYDATVADLGELAADLVDARAVVLGAPTVLNGIHPLALTAAHLVKILKPPVKYGVFVGSYGWGGGALKHVQELLGPTGIDLVGAFESRGRPTPEDMQQVLQLGERLATRIKA